MRKSPHCLTRYQQDWTFGSTASSSNFWCFWCRGIPPSRGLCAIVMVLFCANVCLNHWFTSVVNQLCIFLWPIGFLFALWKFYLLKKKKRFACVCLLDSTPFLDLPLCLFRYTEQSGFNFSFSWWNSWNPVEDWYCQLALKDTIKIWCKLTKDWMGLWHTSS